MLKNRVRMGVGTSETMLRAHMVLSAACCAGEGRDDDADGGRREECGKKDWRKERRRAGRRVEGAR